MENFIMLSTYGRQTIAKDFYRWLMKRQRSGKLSEEEKICLQNIYDTQKTYVRRSRIKSENKIFGFIIDRINKWKDETYLNNMIKVLITSAAETALFTEMIAPKVDIKPEDFKEKLECIKITLNFNVAIMIHESEFFKEMLNMAKAPDDYGGAMMVALKNCKQLCSGYEYTIDKDFDKFLVVNPIPEEVKGMLE